MKLRFVFVGILLLAPLATAAAQNERAAAAH